MKLLIYSKINFEFKEELDVSEDYEIILDIVVNQNSYFVTNHNITKAIVGDIVILHERSFFFIGSIIAIELNESNQLKIIATDYISSLKFEMRVVSFSGNIGSELIRYIRQEYSNNQDEHQNRQFLKLVNDSTIEGKIDGEEDRITKFDSFYTGIYKEHRVRLHARLGIVDGKITHIKILALDAQKELTLASNFPMIRGLEVSENNQTPVNKITFIPSIKNTINTTMESFYLLDDGTITSEKSSNSRIPDVVEKKMVYKDDDLAGSIYSHKFTSGQIKTSAGYIVLGGVSWHQTSATYIGFDGTSTARGVQIGSGPNPQTTAFILSVPISNLAANTKVTEVKITLAAATLTSQYMISVGSLTGQFKQIESNSNKVYTTGRINETAGYIGISLIAQSGAVYISKIEISYQPKDSDVQTLLEMASKELLKEDFMHSITFSISKNNLVFIPFSNIHLGDKVLFLHKEKYINTILSKIEMNSTIEDYLITLGEERSKLTEKLKIILEGK